VAIHLLCNEVCGNWLQNLSAFYRILQITFINERDNCLSVYIVSVKAIRTTVKLLFLLIHVCITETAFNNIRNVEV